jgi:hypothetical protein
MDNNDWVIDISLYPAVVFVPYNNGGIVLGINLMTERCPGNLIGIIHINGQEAVEEWIAAHPDWLQTYSRGVSDETNQT